MSPQITSNDIKFLKGVGEKRAQLFHRLGVDTVDALLRFYPRTYDDFSSAVSLADAPFGEPCFVKATLISVPSEHYVRKGMVLYKAAAADHGISLKITLFNNKYLASKLKTGEEYIFMGKINGNLYSREMTSPEIIPLSMAYIRPIYRQTEGLPSRIIENSVRSALMLKSADLIDPIPESIRLEYALLNIKDALKNIHFPKSPEDLENARKRLVFEELLVLQLGILRLKSRTREETGTALTQDYTEECVKLFPFTLTGAQRRAISEAVDDMSSQLPMNRLVQGDVGSGKTAVAAALCYNTAKNGLQCVLMAPTEILAEQHYRSLSSLLNGTSIRTALLTGSSSLKEKSIICEQLKTQEIDFIIGTHALLEDRVEFKNLGLVITDEQHRFGVAQRATLAQKGQSPHLLVMSATPIPRTLALMIYGDLDVSVLDELPPGRQKIDTYAVSGALRNRAYHYIKKHLDEGRQGYIVCPLVEESDLELAAAEKYAEELSKNEFKDYRIGLLHGRMKSSEKETVMRRFLAGDIQLLVSTTVIEVGVDVPNAVIMMIENAERFGLSQLHQLRGRVGRGIHKSTCILISDAQNDEAVRRLKVMCEQNDGFKIAEDDLKLRGPGDFFGHRQHGLPDLKIANIFSDMAALKLAQSCARNILALDPLLKAPENRGLSDEVNRLFSSVTESGLN